MLSRAQEKFIASTHTKKGRDKTGLVLLEGQKLIEAAGGAVELTFDESDTPRFADLVTTVTPQMKAGLARLPHWSWNDIEAKRTIVVLDHVQDPGNLGTIFRSALAFEASLILVECVDPGNPKVIRGSAGALFHVPWVELTREKALEHLSHLTRPLYRLEIAPNAVDAKSLPHEPLALIAGSEGQGITLPLSAPSVKITHDHRLESLNVAVAVSLVLFSRFH